MKIPESAMKSMMELVVAALPYENRIEPTSNEARLTQNIIDELVKCGPEFDSLTGFFNLIIKKMDSCPDKQKVAHDLFVKVHNIIEEGILMENAVC